MQAYLPCCMPICACTRPTGPIRRPDEIHPISRYSLGLEISIIETLEYSQGGSYTRDGQGQQGESDSQGKDDLERPGPTEPVQRSNPNQGCDEQ